MNRLATVASRRQLARALGFWGATGIVTGSMIGSAIFVVPALITKEVGSRHAGIAVWLVSGALSLFGALCFAELSSMMPQAGGQYVYLREAYGSLVSFLCGWVFFLAAQSGGIAAVAAGLALYVGSFFPFSIWQQRIIASAVIVILTSINYRGIRTAGSLQGFLTGTTVGIVVSLIAIGYVLVREPPGGLTSLPVPSGFRSVGSFGAAMAAALWAYDGWNSITFTAGEVKHAERTLPLVLVIGTVMVITMYVGLNMLYYHVLTLPEIARSPRVAEDAAMRIMGPKGSQLVSLVIVVAAFGSANVSILGGARIYFAMAQDGLFFRWCAAIHPRFHTPHLALTAQAVWAILLVFSGRYEDLFTYTVFAAWIFYALAAYAVIVLRKKRPDLKRPYRVFAYPWIPLIFVAAATAFIANTLVEKPVEGGWGCMLMAMGVPIYFIWRKQHR